MNPIVQESIKRLKKMGQHKMATLVGLAYSLGQADKEAETVPQGLKDAYEGERWQL